MGENKKFFKVKFYNFGEEGACCAEVELPYSGKIVKGIKMTNISGEISCEMPPYLYNQWRYKEIGWEKASSQIISAYQKMQKSFSKSESIEKTKALTNPSKQDSCYSFSDIKKIGNVITCNGSVKLNKKLFHDFKLKLFEDGRVEVTTPATLGKWNHPKYKWETIRKGFSEELKKTVDFKEPENELLSRQKKDDDRNHYGRIRNAKHSDFVYYPHTMLRTDTKVEEENEKKTISILAQALSKGPKSGIGPFEINALWWISKLRYVTNLMLTELATYGYISLGWRESVSQNKVSDITKRMYEYNMITISRFACVNEDGSEIDSTRSASRIMTLAPNGGILLKELGKEVNKYNPFTVLQDGNTVKRYLVANQWLIYWLKAYKERIGENYESAILLQRKGEEFAIARIYASVTIDDIVMVAEPIRRVDKFEEKENKRGIISKIGRMIELFDNMDQLYCFNQKIDFPSRPIIVLLCEDDEHIKDVIEIIYDITREAPEQEFWFSTDLRVFNMDNIGKRFLKLTDNGLEIVNMSDYFGYDGEAEQDTFSDDSAAVNEDSSDDGYAEPENEEYLNNHIGNEGFDSVDSYFDDV